MTEARWLDTALSLHIPYLDLKVGADLNDDGRIEGSERTDLDGDCTVDTEELRKFLSNNRNALTNLGGYFKHYYSAGTFLKPDNPIHDILLKESEATPAAEMKKAYGIMNRIVRKVSRRSSRKKLSPQRKLKLVHNAMKREGLKFSDDLAKESLVESINSGVLSPYHKSCIAIAVAHESDWPIEEMDQYLWLEDIEEKRALAWVQEHNSRSLTKLESDPRFEELRKTALHLMEDENRIPDPDLRGKYIYSFWRDSEHVRGIWRRTTIEGYESENPSWETVLDIDALADAEGENWVIAGANCLPAEYEHCLISLSRGGKDAVVIREFDARTKQFVKGGFYLEEGKHSVRWLDPDHLLVMTDFGQGTLTPSGYPRIIKEWRRGDPLEGARLVFEGLEEDITVFASRSFRPEGILDTVGRVISPYKSRLFVRRPDESLVQVPVPDSAQITATFDGQLLFILREEWRPEGADAEIPAGSLISLDARHLRDGQEGFPAVDVIMKPSERTSIENVNTARNAIYVTVLDNLNGRVVRFTRSSSGGQAIWEGHDLPVPIGGQISVTSSSSFSDNPYLYFENFLTPKSLLRYDPKTDTLQTVKAMEAAFDAEDFVVEQHEATSSDGTRVPYFVVRSHDIPYDGSTPTLLYGYGGFGQSQLPDYSKITGKLWLERGGAYVLANIRGGGEFGPEWYEAAVKENRQRSFDDFIAVAEDLIRRKITSPRHLGIEGYSNGGLLVSAVAMQRPELFNAVVGNAPLLDMLRYSKLPPGASWIEEYGDPDDPAMREAILGYSPYHNVQPDIDYPEIFFTTSTMDDRVHPGHARKMVARMEEMGHPVLYYENTEGGHDGASNLRQAARSIALIYTYLFQKLFDGE
jgi:prolyl oligopeptidase